MGTNINNQWFKVVEIEVNSRCNLKCSYCPNSILPTPDVPEYMSDEVFERIINELVRINFSGIMSYHFYNEPLLRKDLEKLSAVVKERLPKVFQLLYTNGDFLSDKRYSSLKKAGIDHFLVTKHSLKPNKARENQTVKYSKDLILTNRGGTIFTLKEPLMLSCYAPTDMLIVTITGEVLLCCNDSKRKNIMGNLINQSIDEIWFSKKFISIRKQLKKGQRATASYICKNCNDKEYFALGENYQNSLIKNI
jgi:GTP 3',8-cyclase